MIKFLGEIIDQYKLFSNDVISQRMIDEIDTLTMSMVEHGFNQFYTSFVDYKEMIDFNKVFLGLETNNENDDDDDDDLKSITIEQFKIPIIIVICLNALPTIIYVAEILVFKWLNWRKSINFFSTGRVQISPLVKRQPKPASSSVDNRNSNRCQTASLRMKNLKRRNAKRKNSRKCRSARF